MLPVEGAEAICKFSVLRRLVLYSPCPLALHDDLLPLLPTFVPAEHFAPACNHVASLHFSLNLLMLEVHFQDKERFEN